MHTEAVFHFPFESFRDAGEFRDFVQEKQRTLDVRYAYEGARAAGATGAEQSSAEYVSAGSCGLCLRATHFTTAIPAAAVEVPKAGEARPRPEPNWREQQLCGCSERLSCRLRGLLHFIVAEIQPPGWTRLLLLGAAQAIEPRLQRMVGSVAVRARSGRLLRVPVFESQAYHLVLSCEHLHAEQDPDRVLRGIRDAVMPGGHFVFTAPFDAAAQASVPAGAGRPGILGWDILDRLGRAGFRGAAAHLYWSEEFGYLGPFNLVFSAAT
jgi:SAM-dependent methyltransferase